MGTAMNTGFLRRYFERLESPHGLVARRQARLLMRATIAPGIGAVTATTGQALTSPVRVVNQTTVDFGWGIGHPVLSPGNEQLVRLGVIAPETKGAYALEVDVVWEGIARFKDRGNRTGIVKLTVN
jgi:hypothetical protein